MRFRCYNPKCGKLPKWFVFEADAPICPKCGTLGQPGVQQLNDVHLVSFHEAGPIKGHFGRQLIACMPTREEMAKHKDDTFAASDDPRAVTCPSCVGTTAYKQLAALYPDLVAAQAIEKAMAGGMKIISDPQCCK